MLPVSLTLENTEGAIEIDNPEKLVTYGTQEEEKHNTIYVGHHYTKTNTNIVSKR
jgi:hypothetical protein